MAVLQAVPTGSAANFTSSTAWALVDSTSYLNSETGVTTVTTSYVGSSTFTPGAITISGIMLKLSARNGTTGTMSVHLALAGVEVTGTLVTINVLDLPASTVQADLAGGWIYFKFASNVLLVAATVYTVEVKTSSATQVILLRDSTGGNWSRALVTSTTQAPAAGDDLIITRAWTAAGTSTTATITQNSTSTATDYGSNTTSLVTPAIAICDGGTLISGVASSTAYQLKVSGNIIVYAGGTLSLGTSGTRLPSTSSSMIIFDCVANVDFGLTVRVLGTCNLYGDNSRLVSTLMTADKAAAATVITLAATTGWAVSDVLAFASTSRTASESESKIILTVDSATQVTLTAGLSNAHSGTSPTQAEVLNLTRNVLIQGTSDSLQAFVDIKATAVVNWSYAEIFRMGSATANKRGIDVATTTGTFNIDKCSLHSFVVTGSIGVNISSTSGTTTSTLAVTSCVHYNISNSHFLNTGGSSGTWTIANSLFVRNLESVTIINLADLGGTFDGIVVSGCASTGGAVTINEVPATGVIVSCTSMTSHSNAGHALALFSVRDSTFQNTNFWRNGGAALRLTGTGAVANGYVKGITFNTGNWFGNTTQNILAGNIPAQITFLSIVISGDTTFSTTNGLDLASGIGVFMFLSCTFGVVSGIKTAHTNDINVSVQMSGTVILNNCILGSATEVASPSNINDFFSIIASSRHDQTNGVHKSWVGNGLLSTDTSIFNTASPSLRMTPISSSAKMRTSNIPQGVKYAGASGTTVTISVWVRKSVVGDGAAYNGNQPTLTVRRNDAVGILANAILATAAAAAGSWEKLTGTTATLSDDGVVELFVDCDGTAGWVNVDDWGT